MGNAVRGFSFQYVLRVTEFVVEADKGLSVGVKSLDRGVYTIERVMVSTLLIFRLVIDG